MTGTVTHQSGATLNGVPGTPSAVTASRGDGRATVQFTPGAVNCSPASYTVTASPGGRTATGSASPIAVTGLTNGTAYTFTVNGEQRARSGFHICCVRQRDAGWSAGRADVDSCDSR